VAVSQDYLWYYATSDETLGPVPNQRLLELLRQRIINGETPVWHEGMSDWMPLRDSGLISVRPVSPPPRSQAPALDDQDQVILDRGNILVSRSVAQFGNTTYAINAIGSMRIDAPQPRTGQKIFGIILTCLGLILALGLGLQLYERKKFSQDDTTTIMIVLAITGIGIGIWSSAKPGPFSLVFRTSSGDVQAYASFDQQDIVEIKQAIETALHLRA
jgi:hypothetical protein